MKRAAPPSASPRRPPAWRGSWGPALAGLAFGGFGRSGPFLAGALVMLGVLLLALRLPGRRPQGVQV